MSSDARPAHRVVPPSRRRDKPILSCTLCRRRKLKCDRQHPCKACQDRGLSLSCSYTSNVASSRPEPRAPANVHDRIDQLEKLVTSLIQAQDKGHETPGNSSQETESSSTCQPAYTPPVEPDADVGVAGAAPDTMKVASDAVRYTNSGHWTSILDGIAELKDELDQIPTTAQPRDDNQSEIQGPDLLFGRQRHATHQELLAALPSRAEADSLVYTYYTAMEMGPALLHRPKFLREYERFWEHPIDTPVMWLGLFYAVLCVATRFQPTIEVADADFANLVHTARGSASMDFYREKTVQCLVLADYSKCPPYTVETVLLYFVSEYLRSLDTQFGTWILVGMIVRMSFRMGYHRDPSKFPEISAFEGEMRRRVWSMIVQLDLMSSSQVGLPKMIQRSMYDTQEPRNLRDEDLNEDMKELPPSRPDSDYTVMLYTLARIRVLDVFGKVMDITNSPTQPAYQDIMELDAKLRDVYDNMPPTLKYIRVKDFVWTDNDIDVRRLFLGLIFLKAELMLHRPFMLAGRTDPRYEYSRLVCLDAALEILEFQLLLNTRPVTSSWSTRFRLWSITWKLSSLVNHDFLLATTVLSLDLHRDLISPLPVSPGVERVRFKNGQPTRAEIVKALTDTYGVWVEACDKSREAQKVAAAVRMVLSKANGDFAQQHTDNNDVPLSAWSDTTAYVQNWEGAFQPTAMNNWMADPASAGFPGLGDPTPIPTFPEPSFDSSMDFDGALDWGTMESDFGFPAFEKYLQESYLG